MGQKAVSDVSWVVDEATGVVVGQRLPSGVVVSPTFAAASPYATLALTAAATGKRQALGATRQVRFTAGGAGSIYVRFSNGSGAIAVASSDTVVDCNASAPVVLTVPGEDTYIEYLRGGGADVNFTLGLMV